MDWLERQLKDALERKQPSLDFAARMIASTRRPPRLLAIPRWLPVAAALVVMAGGSVAWREHQGRVAKERVLLAMRITAGKLNHIQARLKEFRP